MFLLTLALQIFVVLGCCHAAGWLAQRAGQPRVVGEMAAGLLLGPSVLGLLAPQVFAAVFPASSFAVLGWVAQAAIAVFMMLIGLELDSAALRRQRWQVVSASLGGIALPFVLGIGTALYLYTQGVAATVGRWPFALFTGTALSMTALPVLARILRDKHMLDTPDGRLAMAAAILSDVMIWVLLTVVLLFCKPGAAQPGLISLGVLWVVAMLTGGRKALTWLLPRLPGVAGHVVLPLLVLLFCCVTADRLGLHLLMGAFLSGLVLPRNTVLRGRLEQLFGQLTGWLLPLFFAYTGLRTHFSVSAEADISLIALITLVACVGKAGGVYGGARIAGAPAAQASVLAALMNARGLMELVIAHIGLDLGLLTPPMFTALVIMAFVTTLLTGPLVNLLQWRHSPRHSADARLL